MFAGAAREAVFSNPEVIRRVNADFVPVALKAALVNDPPADEEGRLYREIGRSRLAPQGICIANSAGKVLEWVLSFDDQKSMRAFFDHSQQRFRESPDARQPVAAERFMKFPSMKRDDIADNGNVAPLVERHAPGKRCPAKSPLPEGTVVARVIGRALGVDGQPVADTVRQEHYVEDRWNLPVEMQESLATAIAEAGTGRVRVPAELARLCVTHAYLGVLDVQPLSNPLGGASDLKQCEFWAEPVGDANTPGLLRVAGQSEVASELAGRFGKDYQHEVKLTWEGFIEMRGNRITHLLLSGRGTEKLKWAEDHPLAHAADPGNEVAFLPGGHRVELACGVRYGIIGESTHSDE